MFWLFGCSLLATNISEFSLVERTGKIITNQTLKGKICVFSFIFTRCKTVCPLMSNNFAILQKLFKKYPDIYLISITGDPEYDKENVLRDYAEKFGASEHWLFLTGDANTIYKLSKEVFKLGLEKSSEQNLKEGDDLIIHSTKFVLVDQNGKIIDYYDGKEEESVKKLYADIQTLIRKKSVLKKLPTLNAILNFASALFLIVGFIFIKVKKITYHRICMLGAFILSVLFLISYLTYHYYAGNTKFGGQGIVRQIYFFILGSHTILAIITVPLAIITLLFALKSQISKHKKVAPITLAIWLYVNITGIVIYFMLY